MPAPNVTEEDVRRIVEREFAPVLWSHVHGLLKSHAGKHWDGPSPRIHCAAIRLANGNIDKLERELKLACIDFRDVVAPAESPRLWKIGLVGAQRLSSEAREELIVDDFDEYMEWLKK